MPPYKGHEYSTLSVNILEIRAIKSRVKIKLKLNVETLSFQYPYVSVFCLHGFHFGRSEPVEQDCLCLQEFHYVTRISDLESTSNT